MQTEPITYRDIAHFAEEYYFLIWRDMLRHYFGWSSEEASDWLSSRGLLDLRSANKDMEFHDDPQDQLFYVFMRDILGNNADDIDYGAIKCAIKNEVDSTYDWMSVPLDFDWPAYLKKVVAVIGRFKDAPSV